MGAMRILSRRPERRVTRPSWLLLGSEPLRAATEYLAHRVERAFSWHDAPPGDGHPVVIFPGLASDGHAVAPLRDHCRRLGYEAFDWGRGLNTGPGHHVKGWLQELADELGTLLDERHGGAVPTLVGWSLGGLYARELAKLAHFPVRQVITIGTPFNGGPGLTHADALFRLLNGRGALEGDTAAWRERLRRPPPVPTTSIYSRSDGVVAWQACRHVRRSPRVQDIEVDGSHLGMGWNPAVLRVVAQCLVQPPGGPARGAPPVRGAQRASGGAPVAPVGTRLAA
jgi:hypothetical protein